MRNRIIIIIVTILSTIQLHAQTKKCKDVLNRTDKLYQSGQIQEAIKTCEPCLRNLRSSEERFEAYRLLGICHLFMNNKRKSLQYAGYMIELKPEYTKYPSIDPSEFTQLINNFEVRDVLFGGMKSGVNLSTPTVLNNYSLFNSPSVYYLTPGYQVGVFGEYLIKKNISLAADLLFQGTGITQKIALAGSNSQSYEENQQSVVFHPYCQFYLILRNRFRIYSGLGTGFSYMLNATGTLESTNLNTGNTRLTSKDVIPERNRLQFMSSMRIGAGYPAGKGYLQFECVYQLYFRNLENPDARYSNQDFIFNNQYVNDDVKLSMFMFNLSYSMPILSVIINHNK